MEQYGNIVVLQWLMKIIFNLVRIRTDKIGAGQTSFVYEAKKVLK